MGLVAGLQAVSRRIMGHAGAYYGDFSGSAQAKIRSLEQAGVVMTDHPAKFGFAVRSLLTAELKPGSVKGVPKAQASGLSATNPAMTKSMSITQNRSICTKARHPGSEMTRCYLVVAKRGLHVKGAHALNLVRSWGIPISPPRNFTLEKVSKYPVLFRTRFNLSRKLFTPHLQIEYGPKVMSGTEKTWQHTAFRMDEPADEVKRRVQVLCEREWGSFGPKSAFPEIVGIILRMFLEKEGNVFTVRVMESKPNILTVFDANLLFTDEPYRSAGRHEDIHSLIDQGKADSAEVEAAKDGIVYLKLEGNGSIGILVNGAGLAMNTNDALHARGGLCANFLDTGGKATCETVKASFRVLLKDPRVRTIFVNIFGGLTRCDMIAEGIILAYKELGIRLPVVVRLRGTNETAGQKMIADSGLPLHAYDNFEEAAQKVIQLAKEG